MLDENIENLSSEEATKNIKNDIDKNENIENLNENKANEAAAAEIKTEEIKDEKEQLEVKIEPKEVVDSGLENSPTSNDTEKEDDIKTELKNEKSLSEDVSVDKKSTVETTEEGSAVPSDKEKEKEKKESKEIPIIDYAKLSLDELVDAMQDLLHQFSIQDVKDQLEILKKDFTGKFKIFIGEKKEEFIKEGGNEIDFKFFSPVKQKFNELTSEFKKKRQRYYKEIEREQKQNLEDKLQLIEKLKDLIDNAEASTMYKNFKLLQDEWRSIGQIPHSKYNDVWRTYHHHVERFYDLLHLNNDFRDLDFKHNFEEKSKLVEKAEKLAEKTDINQAFKELQILHRMWKEDIGPVARDMREDIWNKFSEATKKIHNKRHELQDQLDAKFKENVDLKLAVIEKIVAINIDNITSHKLWQDNIKNLEKIREEFFAIGRVPRSKNEEIWQLFKDATRSFNKAKNHFYKGIKKDQSENLNKKMLLVEQAESLKDTEDWDIATEVFKKIQFDWKNIGHVPRRDSDKIWKRFKNACNHYFDRLHNKQDDANKEQTEVFNKKKELLEQFKAQINQEDNNLTLDLVNSYIKDWKELGVVPVKMRHIDTKFNKTLDVVYKKLNIDKDEAIFLKFKNIIDNYTEQNDTRKIESEHLFVRRKVDELTKEIKQLENNISFISNATEDNPLVKNVYKNIAKYNENLKLWQKKLIYLNHLDY